MTLAPSALPTCSEATPTPDDTPVISSHSPGLQPAVRDSMSCVTMNTSGIAAACSHDKRAGTRSAFARVHERVVRETADAAAHDALADCETRDAGAEPGNLARALDAGRFAGRVVRAVAGQELAAIERRGSDLDEELTFLRRRLRDVARLERETTLGLHDPVRSHRAATPPRRLAKLVDEPVERGLDVEVFPVELAADDHLDVGARLAGLTSCGQRVAETLARERGRP